MSRVQTLLPSVQPSPGTDLATFRTSYEGIEWTIRRIVPGPFALKMFHLRPDGSRYRGCAVVTVRKNGITCTCVDASWTGFNCKHKRMLRSIGCLSRAAQSAATKGGA